LVDVERTDGDDHMSHQLVVRVEPTDWQVFLDNDLRRQYVILRALWNAGTVPVPEPRWFETDESVLGASFLVMDRVEGRIPTEDPVVQPQTGAWIWDASAEQRRALWHSAVDALAAIHRCDYRAMGLHGIGRSRDGATGLDQELAYWHDYADRIGTLAHTPLLTAVRKWLLDAFPERRETGLAWGDARIQNMVFDEHFAVRAVLDWEMSSLAGPLVDLGWWLVNDRAMAEAVVGTTDEHRLDGLGSRAETIALWEQLTGRDAEDIEWYEAFAAYRLALIYGRLLTMMQEAGVPATDGFTTATNPGTHDLARMFGLHALVPGKVPTAASPVITTLRA
jgi:aminoglycoside phosphotransferase (APT) family kinase protein